MRAEIGTPAEGRHYRRHLLSLTQAVAAAIKAFDEVAKEPQSVERGRKLAKIMNLLEMSNDSARHFGFGKNLKRKKRRSGNRRSASRQDPLDTAEAMNIAYGEGP